MKTYIRGGAVPDSPYPEPKLFTEPADLLGGGSWQNYLIDAHAYPGIEDSLKAFDDVLEEFDREGHLHPGMNVTTIEGFVVRSIITPTKKALFNKGLYLKEVSSLYSHDHTPFTPFMGICYHTRVLRSLDHQVLSTNSIRPLDDRHINAYRHIGNALLKH